MFFKQLTTAMFMLAAILAVAGCNQTKPQNNDSMNIREVYEVHEDGRIYAFYDKALYHEFLQLGETAYRLTRIGSGPNGETMVFGLTKADKKKGANTPAIQLYEGKLKPGDDFYAETRRHGRIYVFTNFDDMTTVRQFGHPNYFYTEIGAGPEGETVVYVLNGKTKKKKPVELMTAFRKHNT